MTDVEKEIRRFAFWAKLAGSCLSLFAPIIEVLDPEPHSAALNMALDERAAATGRAPDIAHLWLARACRVARLFQPLGGSAAGGGRPGNGAALDGRRARGARRRPDLHAPRPTRRRLFPTRAVGILPADPRAHRAVVDRARDRRARGSESSGREIRGVLRQPCAPRHCRWKRQASRLAMPRNGAHAGGCCTRAAFRFAAFVSKRAISPAPSPCTFSKPRSARSSFNPRSKSRGKNTRPPGLAAKMLGQRAPLKLSSLSARREPKRLTEVEGPPISAFLQTC